EAHGSAPTVPPTGAPGEVRRVPVTWPAGVPEGGRHGFAPEHEPAFARAVGELADSLDLGGAERVHVLGHEELIYLPVRLADAIERRDPGRAVTVSSTTRSPVLAVDDPSYAVRDALVFPAH